MNKRHFFATLNMTIRQKYESVGGSGIDSEFNFHFHIHKLEADY